MNSAVLQKTALSRADLLRLALAFDGDIPAPAAQSLGYQPPQTDSNNNEKPVQGETQQRRNHTEPQPSHPVTGARYLVLSQRTPLHGPEGPRAAVLPAWLAATEPLAEDALPPSARLPDPQPLLPWSRLWPFLRRVLSLEGPTRELDIPRLVWHLSRGTALQRLPVTRRRAWAPRAILLLDYAETSAPYHRDFNALCDGLRRLRGAYGLEIRLLHGEAGARPQYLLEGENPPRVRTWTTPPADTPLFILSDLGQYAGPQAVDRWQRFGQRLAAAGLRPPVLCPVPPRRQHAGLQRVFDLHGWDRAVSPQHRQIATPAAPSPALETLLGLLTLTLYAEPELLRELRTLLPAYQADVGLEQEIRQHPDIAAWHTACTFTHAAARERHESALRQLPPHTLAQAIARIRAWHAGRVESVNMQERELHERLCPEQVSVATSADLLAWQRRTIRTVQTPAAPAELGDWLQHRDRRLPLPAKARNEEAAILCAQAVQQRLAAGQTAQLPPELAACYDLRPFLGVVALTPRPCAVQQHGEGIWLSAESTLPGVELARLNLSANQVWVARQQQGETAPPLDVLPITALPLQVATLDRRTESLTLEFPGLERLSFQGRPKPPWAASIRQDAQGLAVGLPVDSKRRVELRWQPAEAGGEGHWLAQGPLAGWEKPGPIREDAFGLYAEFSVAGVAQRCRWIRPGTFWMGSPEDEAGRNDYEGPQHEVTLSGYWLADTACTQALWQAVMGQNQSYHKNDPHNPVEQVSWNDGRAFFEKLNALVPGLNAGYSSEAQWEYACRAGTTTAYSFGSEFRSDLANNGGETVPVHSLPPNPWGLHEMHGNVREWCSDWFSGYAAAPQADPEGPAQGSNRVLRGGSWLYGARYLRSASRSRIVPGYRFHLLGLRVAPGRAGLAEPPEPAEPAGAGQGVREGRTPALPGSRRRSGK